MPEDVQDEHLAALAESPHHMVVQFCRRQGLEVSRHAFPQELFPTFRVGFFPFEDSGHPVHSASLRIGGADVTKEESEADNCL